MKQPGKVMLVAVAFALATIPLLSQTAAKKPAFDVVSIKPSAPSGNFIRGGGPRGDRFNMTGATLRVLLQMAYQKANNTPLTGQMQIIGGPNWMETERYDIQAKADCTGGTISREQTQLMIQSMLEDRFQLKAHLETRELPIYTLVVGKDGPKIKRSEDQTTPPFATAAPLPCDQASAAAAAAAPPPPPPPPPPAAGLGQRGAPIDINKLPKGAMIMMSAPTGMTLAASGTPFTNLVGLLQQQLGRTIVDKTNLSGLYDFKMTFSPEGLSNPLGPNPGPQPPGPGIGAAGPAPTGANSAADPVPSIFAAIQELGLKLESGKGPVEVLIVESVQKPSEN